MNLTLAIAACLAFLIGIAHSVLGERYILIRLFRRSDLPRLFGSDWFTRRTLRFAWHLTTVAWWGLGAVLVAASVLSVPELRQWVLKVVAATFLVSSLITVVASRGRHLAWLVFLAIALLTAWAALSG